MEEVASAREVMRATLFKKVVKKLHQRQKLSTTFQRHFFCCCFTGHYFFILVSTTPIYLLFCLYLSVFQLSSSRLNFSTSSTALYCFVRFSPFSFCYFGKHSHCLLFQPSKEFTLQVICIKSTYSKNPSTSKSTMSFVLFCLFFMFLFILKTNYNACNRCSSDKNKQVPIILTLHLIFVV